MKWKIMRPYITDLFLMIFIYLVMPLILIGLNIIKIQSKDFIQFSIMIILFAGYMYFFSMRISLGLFALLDFVFKTYVEKEMTLIGSYYDESKITLSGVKKNHNDHVIFRRWFQKNEETTTLVTTLCINLNVNSKYVVKYGKYSKIVISLIDDKKCEKVDC